MISVFGYTKGMVGIEKWNLGRRDYNNPFGKNLTPEESLQKIIKVFDLINQKCVKFGVLNEDIEKHNGELKEQVNLVKQGKGLVFPKY